MVRLQQGVCALGRCGVTAFRHQNGANTMRLCTFARTASGKAYRQVTFSDFVHVSLQEPLGKTSHEGARLRR